MMTTKTPRARSRRDYVTAGLASMMGTTIEWYDFFLYGTAAALIFNKIFFPSFDPLTGTLAAFATYSVGFFARPLGGVIFGHYGDKIGRKSMLLITLLLMGVPTILIGLIPSYDQIGYWAAVLLVLMRFLQGIAVGGEWGGAVLMAVEHAPEGKKGFFGSLPQAGVAPGLILSSLAMGAVAGLPEQDMLSWGWRLPFLASVVLLRWAGSSASRWPSRPTSSRCASRAPRSRCRWPKSSSTTGARCGRWWARGWPKSPGSIPWSRFRWPTPPARWASRAR